MKTRFLLVIFLFASTQVFAENYFKRPRFDERVDLLAIVNRLAGSEEYINNKISEYAQLVDEHFKPFINHPIIEMTQNLRSKYSISYDAVASLALNIEIKDSIVLNKDFIDNNLDFRWNNTPIDEYIILLNDFYKQSAFNNFFQSKYRFYNTAIDNFSDAITRIDFGWFDSFFGERPEGYFQVILSMNIHGGYRTTITLPGGNLLLYPILGTNFSDSDGMPTYNEVEINMLVSEINRLFFNPLLDVFFPYLSRPVDAAFNIIDSELPFIQYGTAKILWAETMIRSCHIMYMKSLGLSESAINRRIQQEIGLGFFWIEDILDLFARYEESREEYPTLYSFMPEIVDYQLSDDFKNAIEEYRKNK